MKCFKLFRKIARNKKGLDPDLTDSLIAVLFSAMIFIFAFLFLANTTKDIEKAAVAATNNLEKNYILLNYLRTPINEKGMTIAEYLGSLSKKELEESMKSTGFCCVKDASPRGSKCTKDGQLTKEANEILKDIANWRVGMLIPGEEEFCYINKGIQQERGVPILGETVKAIIPSNDHNFNIDIYFKFKS